MWPFTRKTRSVKNVLAGFTDCHSHILPGVDDGVPGMEQSLKILHFYEELGVDTVWLTPHIMEDIPNTTELLKSRFEQLQTAYSGSVRLRLAAEYMMDSLFKERLKTDDLLLLGERNDHLLVETSYFSAPIGLQNTFQQIKSKGYYPVLAHPERYMYMDNEEYKTLKEAGVKFQLNISSLFGFYGNRVKERALWLQKQSMYDLQGTDIHNLEVFKELISLNTNKLSILSIR